MATFTFKVYLNDGNSKTVTPSDLRSYELHDLDSYAHSKKMMELDTILKTSLGTKEEIRKIFIVPIKHQNIEYSLVNINPFFEEVYGNISKKSIFRDNHYEDVYSINGNCRAYREMKDYLFDQIDKNSKYFFEYVYNKDNNLRKLLERYLVAKNTKSSEEDNRNLSQLKDEIENELKVYRTYRGLAVARYIYDSKAIKNPLRKHNDIKYEEQKSVEYVPRNIKHEEIEEPQKEDEYEEVPDLSPKEMLEMGGGEENGIFNFRYRK